MDKNENLNLNEIFTLAVQNQQKNNLKVAQDLYNKVLKIVPNHLGSLNNLGSTFKALGEFQKAKDCYEKAIEIDPNFADVYNNLGATLIDLGEKQKAIDYFKKAIEIKPTYGAAYNNLGSTLKTLGEFQKAKICYEKVIEIDPNYADVYNNLGATLVDLGELQKAIDCFEKAIKINPNSANTHNNLGIIFQGQQQNLKAIDCFEKAIKINPNYADAITNLAVACKTLGEYKKAEEYLNKAIKLNPDNWQAFSNLGLLSKELGNYQKAIDCIEKAIKINPKSILSLNNLGTTFRAIGENQKAIDCYEKALAIDPNAISPLENLASDMISLLNDFDKAISSSYKVLKIKQNLSKFFDQSVPLFRLKHDVQQAKYLSSKNYKVDGIDQFQKIGDEILSRKENKEDDNSEKRIVLTPNEVSALLPFYKSDFTYKPKKISGGHINPNKNWLEVEDEYFNSSNQIMYIDDFLSDEALIELREFCLVSKVWNKEYLNKYLGVVGEGGFISQIHLQIAIELKQKLPKLFGPHKIEKFWGFKYDSTLGKGINIHADFALHNLNFWITPDEYNNNKNGGGLKVYDTPAPDHWTFRDYNTNASGDKIYEFLKENNANCVNVPHKYNRAVLFNSAYFHETDEIDFKDEYEGRRINNTYLFGNRLVKQIE